MAPRLYLQIEIRKVETTNAQIRGKFMYRIPPRKDTDSLTTKYMKKVKTNQMFLEPQKTVKMLHRHFFYLLCED